MSCCERSRIVRVSTGRPYDVEALPGLLHARGHDALKARLQALVPERAVIVSDTNVAPLYARAAADALGTYVPAGMRQKVVDVDGVTSIEDCYNASPDSMRAALKTLSNIKGNKKIAVLGDMLELGDYAKTAHTEVGKVVAENKIDYLLAYGNDAKFYVDGAKQDGVENAFLFDDKEKLSEMLLNIATKGDAILFKGSRGMKLEDVINTVYKGWRKQ